MATGRRAKAAERASLDPDPLLLGVLRDRRVHRVKSIYSVGTPERESDALGAIGVLTITTNEISTSMGRLIDLTQQEEIKDGLTKEMSVAGPFLSGSSISILSGSPTCTMK